jgi:DUF971 family protein
MTIKPREIQASRSKGTLSIIWQDGHQSVYRFEDLRAACPCAECQGTHETSGAAAKDPLDLNLPLRSDAATKLDSLEQVGNYALQITWQDGHRFGIYTWEYLRSLSPSDEHTGSGEGDG